MFKSDFKFKTKFNLFTFINIFNNLSQRKLIKSSFVSQVLFQETEHELNFYLAATFGRNGIRFRTDVMFLTHVNGAQLAKVFTS